MSFTDDTPISDLNMEKNFGLCTRHFLEEAGFTTVGAVRAAPDHVLLRLPNMGPRRLQILRKAVGSAAPPVPLPVEEIVADWLRSRGYTVERSK